MNKTRIMTIAPVLLVLASCASSDGTGDESQNGTNASVEVTTAPADDPIAPETAASDTSADSPATETAEPETAGSCDDVAALFTTRGSANADLAEPESSAVCDGDSIVITSNGIPDYTYIGTSPGSPNALELEYTIPAAPTVAEATTDVPLLGAVAVTLGGVPIYGPTEGTGGDVLSAEGLLSACGSHRGPTDFHIHYIGTSEDTDCLFTPAEVAAGPQLVGYAFDGYPIYTGADQYTSSWQLTDDSLFATDTWAAHSYVEGSGDLDECNGLTDADGNYAYYTTDTFPYVLGCYTGSVELAEPPAGGGGGRGEPPAGEGGGRGGPPASDDVAGQGDARGPAPEGD
ncbi:MAG TPA: YHYH protein [Ilumatobacteraceae bacterium]|nr:YHYH protein [Ilumatobacteraceae bacterium]